MSKPKVTLDEQHMINMADKWAGQLGENTDKSRFVAFRDASGAPDAALWITGPEMFEYTLEIVRMTVQVVNMYGEIEVTEDGKAQA